MNYNQLLSVILKIPFTNVSAYHIPPHNKWEIYDNIYDNVLYVLMLCLQLVSAASKWPKNK